MFLELSETTKNEFHMKFCIDIGLAGAYGPSGAHIGSGTGFGAVFHALKKTLLVVIMGHPLTHPYVDYVSVSNSPSALIT